MASIRIRTGSEGPAHDPYGYQEIEFTRTDGVVVTLHSGLGEWCEVYFPNRKEFRSWSWDNDAAVKAFQDLTGLHPMQAVRINDRLHPYVEDPYGCLADYE